MLIRITAPHFVAGIWNGEPAPIIHYMRGWSVERIQKYANNKNWEIQIMAEFVRGTIQQVPKPREFVSGNKTTYYYSIKVNDVYYSAGSKKPPEPGTLVEFEWEAKGDYKNITKTGIRVVPAGNPSSNVGNAAVAASSHPTHGAMSKDDYWRRKEERDLAKEAMYETKDRVIQLQSCRNSAIEFVKLLVTPLQSEDKDGNPKQALPALKLGAQNKREQILFEAVQKYTEEFWKLNQSLNTSENNNKNEQGTQSDDSSSSQSNREADRSDAAWEL